MPAQTLRSEREIQRMRVPGLAVRQALELAMEMIAPGVTTREIDDAVAEHFRRLDAVPLFKNYPNPTEGGPPFPGVTCMSLNDEVVHGVPSDRQLVEGDILSIDTGCRIGGWCGDSAVTLAVGEIAPAVRRLLEVTKEVLDIAIDLLDKKQWWSQVAAEMDAFVRANGMTTVESFVGHGIGREMHELPQVPNFVSPQLRRHGDFRLEPGLVLAIEPMVNLGGKAVKPLPDQWTMVTADGKPSAHFEHTVAITESGVRILTAPATDEER